MIEGNDKRERKKELVSFFRLHSIDNGIVEIEKLKNPWIFISRTKVSSFHFDIKSIVNFWLLEGFKDTINPKGSFRKNFSLNLPLLLGERAFSRMTFVELSYRKSGERVGHLRPTWVHTSHRPLQERESQTLNFHLEKGTKRETRKPIFRVYASLPTLYLPCAVNIDLRFLNFEEFHGSLWWQLEEKLEDRKFGLFSICFDNNVSKN